MRLGLLIQLLFLVDALAQGLARPADSWRHLSPPSHRPSDASHPGACVYPVFFDWDQAELSSHARDELAAATRDAACNHRARIELLGAEDAHAGPSYRAALADARRRNVLAELLSDGAIPSQPPAADVDGAATLAPM